MNPSAGSGHWGQTVPVDREITDLAQIEAEMRCAVAGQIAESEFLPTREKLRAERTDNSLIRRFKRNAEQATEDPNLPDNDDLIFAKMGIARDSEIRQNDPDAATGPASWIPVYREAEQLIRDELWPAVQAVGEELSRSTANLRDEDIAALATAALNRTEPMKLT
jgi:hypothetical protein